MAHLVLALLSTLGSAAAIRIATHRRPLAQTERELQAIKQKQRDLARQHEVAQQELERERQLNGDKDAHVADLASRLEEFKERAETLAREKQAAEAVRDALAAQHARLAEQTEQMAHDQQQLMQENTNLVQCNLMLEAERDDALLRHAEQESALAGLKERVTQVLEGLFESGMGPEDAESARQQLAELGVTLRFLPHAVANSPVPTADGDAWEHGAPSFVLDSPGKMQRLMHACMAAPRMLGEGEANGTEETQNRVMTLSYPTSSSFKERPDQKHFSLSWLPRTNSNTEGLASSSAAALQAPPAAASASTSATTAPQLKQQPGQQEPRTAQPPSDVASTGADTPKGKGAASSSSKQPVLQGSHLVFTTNGKQRQPKGGAGHQKWNLLGGSAPGMLAHAMGGGDGMDDGFPSMGRDLVQRKG